MGWRFRKSFKILPGIRINIGKRGISGATLGKRGFTTSIGKQGVFQNLGLAGTGLSYRSKLGDYSRSSSYIGFGIAAALIVGVIVLCVLFAGLGGNTTQRKQAPPVQFVAHETPFPIAPKNPINSGSTTRTKTFRTRKSSSDYVDARPSSKYIIGPRGGCFYMNSKGRKIYVDHKNCN